MDVTTAVGNVKRQFGDEYDVIITTDDIYAWIYEAELDIIRNTGSKDTTITVASSAFPSTVPDSVTISRVAVNGNALTYTSKEEIDLGGNSLGALGPSQYWYFEDKKVYIYPTDASVFNVDITYSKTPTLMAGLPSANVFSVPENYRTDVVNFCLAKAHNKNRNYQAEKVFMDLYDRSLPNRREEEYDPDAPIYKAGDPMDHLDYNYDW